MFWGGAPSQEFWKAFRAMWCAGAAKEVSSWGVTSTLPCQRWGPEALDSPKQKGLASLHPDNPSSCISRNVTCPVASSSLIRSSPKGALPWGPFPNPWAPTANHHQIPRPPPCNSNWPSCLWGLCHTHPTHPACTGPRPKPTLKLGLLLFPPSEMPSHLPSVPRNSSLSFEVQLKAYLLSDAFPDSSRLFSFLDILTNNQNHSSTNSQLLIISQILTLSFQLG